MSEFISFSAKLNGKDVRITCPIAEVEVVTRDNEEAFDVEEVAGELTEIEFEEVYDG